MKNLEEILRLAESTDCLERIFIWGSFVTSKEFPGDLDLFMVMARDFDLDKANAEASPLFNHAQARISFNSDVFWAKSSIGEEAIDMWLETYQMTREFVPRGIVEVRRHDQE